MENKNTELKSSFIGVKVHPTASVDPSAELHDGVIISQGATVGPNAVSYTHLTLPTRSYV